MPRTKIREQFEIAEMPSGSQSSTHLAFEAGKWKAKYETIKEVLDYERKKRKEVETNLNKLAYELGGVKNEVRQLEEKIRLLTGAPAEKKKEESQPFAAEVPELRYQPAKTEENLEPEPEKTKKEKVNEPYAGTTESPRLYIKFASAGPEIQSKPEAEPEIKFEMAPAAETAEEPIHDVMTALETSFKAETAETWGYATALMNTLKSSPAELYHERVNDQEAREGFYYGFVDRIKKLNADYRNYRDLIPVIDSDLKNLEKVIPYVDYSLAELYQEA